MEKEQIRELLIREEKARKQIVSPIFDSLGLTPGQGQARILNQLLNKDKITQKELADICKLDAPTMSRNLDKLEKFGYLKRENNPECRRSFLVCLTSKGHEKALKIRAVFQQIDSILCMGLTTEEISIFCKILNKMCTNLEEQNQK